MMLVLYHSSSHLICVVNFASLVIVGCGDFDYDWFLILFLSVVLG